MTNNVENGAPLSQRIAEKIAGAMGFRFLIIQTIVIILWMLWNVSALVIHYDPYPFILLNLALSLQAAAATPILMIANKRQERLSREMNQETHDRVLYMFKIMQDTHMKHTEKLKEVHEDIKKNN